MTQSATSLPAVKLPVIGPGDALIIVDVQNDFLPGGALAVPEGDAILPVVNALVQEPFGMVVASLDWHPAEHGSFKPAGAWPVHCVADTWGAALSPALKLPQRNLLVLKGQDTELDAYSAFEGRSADGARLAETLRQHGIERVFVCGLALEYCVRSTAQDAMAEGFSTFLLTDATRGLEPSPTPTLRALHNAGVTLCHS
jgi:nicotinamidase/pyrazinamidase